MGGYPKAAKMANDDESEVDSDRENEEEEEEEEETLTPKDSSSPTIPFDAKTMDLIIDFRSVCSLPFDPATEGTKALRALKFGKGKGIHAPNEPGKVFVCGEWQLLTVLMKVYFAPATHREPEFLLTFVDYGFANPAMNGVSVETLSLPLLIKKGVYQDSTRLTRIEDVAGFTPINPGHAPWSITMKPALQKQNFFKTFKIYAPADVPKWLTTQKMDKRIETLAKRTRVAMVDAVKELDRQDPHQASKTKAVFEAKLDSILKCIDALPPSAYDARMATRVIQLVEDRDKELDPVWLTSPIHKGMREGNADFNRTRLHKGPDQAPKSPVEALPRPDLNPNSTTTGAGTQGADEELEDDLELSESEVDSDVQELGPPRESNRKKRAPARLSQEQERGAAGGPKPKSAKPVSKPATAPAESVPKVYTRGPYKRTSASAAKALAKAEKEKGKKELSLTAEKLELASLRLQLKAALESKKAADEHLKQSSRMVELEIAKAFAEGEKSGLRTAGEEYKKGIAAGAAIAQGKQFSFVQDSPMPSSSASAHSHRGSTFGSTTYGQL